MDVAFVVDDTGSMGGAIDNVKAGLADIITQVDTASGGDFQLALVSHKDDVEVDQVFTTDDTAVTSAVNALSATGGAGEPEASDEALNTTVNALNAADRSPGDQTGDFTDDWRAGAIQIAIIITDARPGGFDDTYTAGVDDVNAHNVALDAADRGIAISAIHVLNSFEDATSEVIMKDYADTTGGVYVETPSDGSGTSTAIEDIIESCGGSGPAPVDEGPCPLSQGFWKNHGPNARGQQSNEWPVEELTIGDVTYTDEELEDLLRTPVRGDASMDLGHQLIAAMLNVENGSTDQSIDETVDSETFSLVSQVIDDADGHLADLEASEGGGLGYDVDEDSDLGLHLIGLSEILEDFNEGTFTLGCNADPAVSKTGASEPLSDGDTVSFDIEVTNNGPGAASEVNLTDTLPEGTWTVSGTDAGDCSIDAGVLECHFGDLDAGELRSLTITRDTAAQNCESDISNTAEVTTTGVDNDDSNNVSSWTLTVECVE